MVRHSIMNETGSSTPRAGFIGFGEVASIFAGAMLAKGASVVAADTLAAQPEGLARLQQRDRSGQVRFVPLAELVTTCDWILSTVTTRSAEAVARAAAAHLRPGQTYVDLNAASPAVKQHIAGIVGSTGAHFVEGAILSAVGVAGAKARILIGDTSGAAAAQALARLGLNTVFYSAEIGRASAFKLLRSIFSKGMEALLIEFLVAGRRAGIQEDLWREVTELFAQNGFERVAQNWIRTHATAHERRYHEVVQVREQMRELGLDPAMTAGTEKVFQRSRELGLDGLEAASADDVIAAIEGALKAKP